MTTEQQPTRIYLVRHGITAWNSQRRFQGQTDIPLSETGHAQADAVAARIAAEGTQFAALYSSDLQRAYQTAQHIGQRIGLEPVAVPDLREISLGTWDGSTIEEIEQQYPEQFRLWREAPEEYVMEGGESFPAVQQRMVAFFDHVLRQHAGESVILVGHGAALRALIAHLQGISMSDFWKSGKAYLGNTSLTIFEVATDQQLSCALLNCTAHLANVEVIG